MDDTGNEPAADEAASRGGQGQTDGIGPAPSVADDDVMGGVFRPGIVNVKLIYAAFLVTPAIPIAAMFGGWFSYRGTQKSPQAWLMTHYRYQLRTFGIGVIANVIAWILVFAGVGLLLIPLIAVWVVVRSVNGLIRVARNEPVENPESWLI